MWILRTPRRRLTTGLLHDPHPHGDDQSGLLRRRDELPWGQQPPMWMHPPDQGFDTLDASGSEIHDRLVVQSELAAAEGAPEVGLHLEPFEGVHVHLGLE